MVISDHSATTIDGAAYVGPIDVVNSDVTIQGQFSGNGTSPSSLSDVGSVSATESLTVTAAASLSLDDLTLSTMSLYDQGLVVTSTADVQNAYISGEDATWFSNQTAIQGELSATSGAALEGNFELESGAKLIADDTALVESGTILIAGDSSLLLTGPSAAQAPSMFSLADMVSLAPGATFTLSSDDQQPILLSGGISGLGTLSVGSCDIVVSQSSVPDLGSPTVIDSPISSGSHTLTVGSSTTLALGLLRLQSSSLVDDGVLNLAAATVINATVSGSEAVVQCSNMVVDGTLTLSSGGQVVGDLQLAGNAALAMDSQSSLSGGTLAVAGTNSLLLVDATSSSATESFDFFGGIDLLSGATLAISGSSSDKLIVGGAFTGAGTLSLGGTDLSLLGETASSMNVMKAAGVPGLAGATVVNQAQDTGIDAPTIMDASAAGVGHTLTIGSSANVSLAMLTLQSTDLLDDGTLDAVSASIGNATINGSHAVLDSPNIVEDGTLTLSNGGQVKGNLLLNGNAVLAVGPQTEVSGGSLTIAGADSLLLFQGSGSQGASNQFSFSDDINLLGGSTLAIVGVPSDLITIDGSVSGSGTLSLDGAYFALLENNTSTLSTVETDRRSTLGDQAAQPPITNSTTYLLTSSSLNLADSSSIDGSLAVIVCAGDSDTVIGGPNALQLTTMGATAVNVDGGSGANTVVAGGAGLTYVQGLGAADVTCSTSGKDKVTVGSGLSVVKASPGAAIKIIGICATTVYGAANSSVDDSRGFGDLIYYADAQLGSSTITGGPGSLTVNGSLSALSVTGGSGKTVVYGGESGHDYLAGGTGENTIIGGAGATIIGKSSVSGIYGDTASGALIDDTASKGNDTLFSGSGDGITTILGGSGQDVFLAGPSPIVVDCGSGDDSVWAGLATADTINGGLGRDLLQGGYDAQVNVGGAQSTIILSAEGGSNINAVGSPSSLTLFVAGAGVTSVKGGSGPLLALANSATLDVSSRTGPSVVWCENSVAVKEAQSVSSTFVLAGAGDTIDATQSSGNDIYFLLNPGIASIQLSSGSNSVIDGSGSANVTLSGGNDTIYAGSGSLSIDWTNIASSTENLVVLDFDPGRDTISQLNPDTLTMVIPAIGTELHIGSGTVLLYSYFGSLTNG